MAQVNRDVFFVFGSVCRILAGKVSPKEWKPLVQEVWDWSLYTVENSDVPTPTPPPAVTEEPAPVPPTTETAVKYLNDEQQVKFTAYAYKQGFSELALTRFLQSRGITMVTQIPLGKAGLLWNELKNPEIQQQFK